jgi:hypothetical protein
MAEIAHAHQASPQALETISKYFDDALVQDTFFEAAHDTLQKLGFKRDNTFVLVNTCRDELARPISHFFDKHYGHTFNLSGISGVVTAGTLGFVAATSHAPANPDGRDKYVFIGATHTAVDQNGTEGPVVREGQKKVSNACGAIEVLLGEIRSGVHQDGTIRDDNVEYDTLKKQIFSKNPPAIPTNFQLTKITAQAITNTLEDHISKTVNPAKADYAVIVGVQIHAGVKAGLWTPESVIDYFAPVTSYVVIKGKKQELKVHGNKLVVA